ncbi:MAG TPA: TIGR02300 family protein [Acetobacteraceae bacterium]
MVKPELGTKRVCVSCGARFYDLTKRPAVCPKCGTEQPVEQPRPRRTGGGNVVEDRRPKKPVPAPGAEEADIEVEGVEDVEEEDVLEDAADLEDDADAIGPDIEVEPDADEAER